MLRAGPEARTAEPCQGDTVHLAAGAAAKFCFNRRLTLDRGKSLVCPVVSRTGSGKATSGVSLAPSANFSGRQWAMQIFWSVTAIASLLAVIVILTRW
jgi:hypothetical protein